MSVIYSFPPIASADANILVLGSMPGKASLEAGQYYAHPRNSFWFIIEQLFATKTPENYQQKKQLLIKNNIAVWDVLKACVRDGSLDAAIQRDSIVANDFENFFNQHKKISCVFFNGATAEKEFIRHVMSLPGVQSRQLLFHRLPSTSPAHAAMSREQKLSAWKIIAEKARQSVLV